VAVDHRRRVRAVLGRAPLPGLVVLVGRVPRHVVDAAGALDPALGGRLVVEVEAAALVAARLPALIGALEAETLLEQLPAALRVGRVRAHGVEAL
jgi:hypothetical protein